METPRLKFDENIEISEFYNFFKFLWADGNLILEKRILDIQIQHWGIFEVSLVKKENKKILVIYLDLSVIVYKHRSVDK